MLYYDRTDVSEGSDINKISAAKECDISSNWYFLDKGYHMYAMGVITYWSCPWTLAILLLWTLMMSIRGIRKSEARKVIQNIDLTEKSRAV